MTRWRLLTFATAMMLALSGCVGTPKSDAAPKEAVAQAEAFADLVNFQRFEEAYDRAGDEFRETKSKDDWITSLAACEAVPTPTRKVHGDLPGNTDDRVEVNMTSGAEQPTFVVSLAKRDDRWVVVGFGCTERK